MSRPTLDPTNIGTNTTNIKMSPIDSIPVRTKTTEPMPLKQPTEFSEQNGTSHVPDDLNLYPSLLDLPTKKKKHNKRKSVINTRNMIR